MECFAKSETNTWWGILGGSAEGQEVASFTATWKNSKGEYDLDSKAREAADYIAAVATFTPTAIKVVLLRLKAFEVDGFILCKPHVLTHATHTYTQWLL